MRFLKSAGGRSGRLALTGAVGAAVAATALLVSPLVASGATPATTGGGTWKMYGQNLQKTNFDSSATAINTSNAGTLQAKVLATATRHIFDQPIEAHGLSFFGSLDGNEYAVNPTTGVQVWKTFVGQLTLPISCNNQVPNPLGVTGTAQFASIKIAGVTTPVVFVPGAGAASATGNPPVLYALNANTGAVVWQTTLNTIPWEYMWDSPVYWDGNVYIGVSSPANCPVTTQGIVYKLNAYTGAIEHTWDAVPNGCIGGGVWGSIALDTAAKALYFGTGSPDYTSCASNPPGTAPGDEPYTPALVELSATDLSVIGSYQLPLTQQHLNGENDPDFGNSPVLFNADDGTPMVAIAHKNGQLYAFDRGKLNAGPVWQYTLSIDNKEPPLAPGAYDGHYLYEAAGPNTIGATLCKGTLYKIDPTTGSTFSTVWQECIAGWPEGAASMAPGLILEGEGKSVYLYSAKTGAQLFSYTDKATNSRFDGSGSFSDGQMFFGNQDGNFYSFAP
jgi:polyvinyl alcohol dehydrogenase (cytochrome)